MKLKKMSKSAREMFEELGYEETNIYDNIIHYEKIDTTDDIPIYSCIEFVTDSKSIRCFKCINDRNHYCAYNRLDPTTLRAIIKKCKELGWLDE